MRDRTIRLQVDVQEMQPEVMSELFSLNEKLGHFFFKEAFFSEIDTSELPPLKLERHEKSPQERLRAVLYVWWSQLKSEKPFDTWYREMMEEYIKSVKEKLDPL